MGGGSIAFLLPRGVDIQASLLSTIDSPRYCWAEVGAVPSTSPPRTLPGRGRSTSYCTPRGLHWHRWGWWPRCLWAVGRVLTPFWAFSGNILAQESGISSQADESGCLGAPLCRDYCGRRWGPQLFSPQILAGAEKLLTEDFLFCYTSPFLDQWLETVSFCAFFFFFFSVCSRWYLQLLQHLVQDIRGKKKTQATDHCIISRVPNSLAGWPSCLYLSESS